MASPSVLFIGVGRMGALMAGRLADAGIALAVADLSPQALESFRARGIPAGIDGADLPGDVVITMLPDDKQVHEALLGPAGACRQRQRKLVIDMTSASPEGTQKLAAELAVLDTGLVDAPVSGGMAGARDGSLTAMVGGDSQAFTTTLPLLQLICAKVFHVGPVGSGHIVKALNNYLSAATLWTATEALVIGTRLGLDPATMLAVWDAGSGKSHATEVKLPQHVLTRRFDFGQSLAFFCKDIAIAEALAEVANVDTPALDAVLANWRHARDALSPQDDITAIARLLEDSARSTD